MIAGFRLREVAALGAAWAEASARGGPPKGVRSAGFDPHFLQKNLSLLFLSKKAPKKTARRK